MSHDEVDSLLQGMEPYDESFYRDSHQQHPHVHGLYNVQGGVHSIGAAVESRMHALEAAVNSLIERVETAADRLPELGPAPEAPPAPTFEFFYYENESLSHRKDFYEWTNDRGNLDKIHFRAGKFYFGQTNDYITNCKIIATCEEFLKISISVRDDISGLKEIKRGYMTYEEYKKLFIFLIAKSGSTDLLGDPIGDHVQHQASLLMRWTLNRIVN